MNVFNTPALDAWNAKVSTPEKMLREIERLRSRARHNEASALGKARREGYREADTKWQGVVAEKDTELAEQAALIAELCSQLGQSNFQI